MESEVFPQKISRSVSSARCSDSPDGNYENQEEQGEEEQENGEDDDDQEKSLIKEIADITKL